MTEVPEPNRRGFVTKLRMVRTPSFYTRTVTLYQSFYDVICFNLSKEMTIRKMSEVVRLHG